MYFYIEVSLLKLIIFHNKTSGLFTVQMEYSYQAAGKRDNASALTEVLFLSLGNFMVCCYVVSRQRWKHYCPNALWSQTNVFQPDKSSIKVMTWYS